MPENIISGRVVLKESGLGVPDLLVVIHDLDPGAPPEDAQALGNRDGVAPAVQPGLGDRLGSRLTDKAGAFHFAFDDAEFGIRNAMEKRPDLHLAVLAPEEPGADTRSRVLFTSTEIRQDAGRTEQYLIRLPASALERAGVPIPLAPAVAREEARAVVHKLEQAAAWRTELEKEARKLNAARVAVVREEARRTDEVVERRLVEALTGLTAEEARSLNVVPPGEQAEPIVWRSAERRIAKVNAQPGVTGYLVLTLAEAERFRENGAWRTQIPADEIEPFLYRADQQEGRPTSITRNDPVEAMCQAASSVDPLAPPDAAASGSTGGNSGGAGGSSGSPLADTEVSVEDFPRLVGRLINGMLAPIETGAGPIGRPDADTVQQTVAGLRIASGPSDVTAFHDYHNLQIAFDYVWKQLLGEDVVETGKTLARVLQEAGSDALTAIEGDGNPIEAMKREMQYLARATSPFDKSLLPDWVRDPVIDGGGGWGPDFPGGGGGGGGGGGAGGGAGGHGPRDDVVGGRPQTADPGPRYPHQLLAELEGMLDERHKFEVFAPGSTNFGLLVTYRQKWEPVTYQAGDLVNTLTLAPKETRKVSSRRTIKRERSVKETETNLRNRSDELKTTMRADAEVVQRASTKTNFNLNAKGSYDIGIASGDTNTTVDRTAEASSQETKKSFHESVMNAAMQLRSEKSWSFESKDAFEEETTDTSEINNPNDELTVTYLFYELERRYRVSEHLHRLTPVVLVAMEVPNPGRRAIDRILLAHSWIINRVLLDDRYRAPLEYLCNRIVGDELGLNQMAQNVSEVRAAVEQLKKMHRDTQAQLRSREAVLTAAIQRRAQKIAGENTEGVAEKAWEWATGSGDEEDLEAARIVEDMQREAYERSVRDEKDIRMRLDAETAALSAAGQAYAKAYAEHMNRRMEVGGLRAHFKENVLYYMQAIWSFTFEDQIFFQLCNVKAPLLTVQSKTYSVAEPENPPISVASRPGRVVLEVTADVMLKPAITVEQDAVTLAEIADLDRPLGFKGNYMIFPLRKSNPLTDLMMVPYVDSELGLHDPDDLGSWAPEDFALYARCLVKVHRDRGDLTPAELEALENRLREQYRLIVSSPRRVSDEIVLPTDSLFIEALPGAHPLLEDFKLAHRLMDVEKVREETRKLKLESLRYAARILDKRFDDPEIERQITIDGSPGGVIVPTDQ